MCVRDEEPHLSYLTDTLYRPRALIIALSSRDTILSLYRYATPLHCLVSVLQLTVLASILLPFLLLFFLPSPRARTLRLHWRPSKPLQLPRCSVPAPCSPGSTPLTRSKIFSSPLCSRRTRTILLTSTLFLMPYNSFSSPPLILSATASTLLFCSALP